MNLTNELINSLIDESKNYVDKDLSKYEYSSDIKHLLYIIIPAFIIKYGLKNKKTILNRFITFFITFIVFFSINRNLVKFT